MRSFLCMLVLVMLSGPAQSACFMQRECGGLRNALTDVTMHQRGPSDELRSCPVSLSAAGQHREASFHFLRRYDPDKHRRGIGLLIAGCLISAIGIGMLASGMSQANHSGNDHDQTGYNLAVFGAMVVTIGLPFSIPGLLMTLRYDR